MSAAAGRTSVFYFIRKCFYEIKNAPRGEHWAERSNVTGGVLSCLYKNINWTGDKNKNWIF